MAMAFLPQMRRCNKCGSVRNDEITNLHLGSGVGLARQPDPLPPARQQLHLLIQSYELKCNLYLYFLISQNLLISDEKRLLAE